MPRGGKLPPSPPLNAALYGIVYYLCIGLGRLDIFITHAFHMYVETLFIALLPVNTDNTCMHKYYYVLPNLY